MAKKTAKNKKISEYNPAVLEKKWQKFWATKKIYQTKESETKKKCYVLDMFPYPSGEGLHVGHPRGYIATDVYSRFKRMQGFNILHPMGWDAFGLPAENYAIKNKIHPRVAVTKNIKRYKEQLSMIGFNYDWSREIDTTDSDYYKWTQWIFLQMYKKGLAYESYEPINWCPSCQTGLANEDVEDGKCERCGTIVEKKPMRQWVLKITDYADRLLKDLDGEEYDMPKVFDQKNPHQSGKPVVKREVAHAIVFDPRKKKYLIIRNKKFGWDTVIIGGIEQGETAVDTARREVKEETGYTDIEFKRMLGGPTETHYYTKHKGENRIAIAQAVYFELKSEAKISIAPGEDEADEVLWVDEQDFVPGKMVNSELLIWLERLKDPKLGWPKPTLDWPTSIKKLQRDWIGKSEGAEIDFPLTFIKTPEANNNRGANGEKAAIKVFTTRPDTLFGVTYLVLAPEHLWVTLATNNEHNVLENKAEIINYIKEVKTKTEIERTDRTKEKTGVELKGVKAINPATGEEIPMYVADYVLAGYGTGAIMAVPAHDERDFEFAKKYNLPIKPVVLKQEASSRSFVMGVDESDLTDLGISILEKTKSGFFKILIPESQLEEYKKFIRIKMQPGFWNEFSVSDGFYFIFKHKDGRLEEMRLNEKTNDLIDKYGMTFNVEKPKDQPENVYSWLAENSFYKEILIHGDLGVLVNSEEFSGLTSLDAKSKIIEKFGKSKTTYKLRDWVFSRQRYWGEPIPIIHCAKCGIVPVPEKDLPVKLPEVKSYAPTGTGESPLADIPKWVNTKCPVCKGPAKRETNTMPQWAGSSWYYLRFMDPTNKKALVDPKKEKYWAPVDMYVGGSEHATRHLIYARFWHKFLYDIGVVTTAEPFKRIGKNLGLILGADGRKMSKRWGNVVNPDEVIKTYGADTLRVYEMFMGPFDQEIAWNTDSMIGSRRFLEKVWRLQTKVNTKAVLPEATEIILNQTIKKVEEDIESFNFNTAVSTLMILVNELESLEAVPHIVYQILLSILAPFAPHITEELWSNLKLKQSIHTTIWPVYDHNKLQSDTVSIAVQVNGRVRDTFEIGRGAEQAEVLAIASARPMVVKWLENKTPAKVIFVPDKLINIVV